MFRSKYFIFFIFFLVVLSIFLASYFDKDNTLKDEAIRFSDLETCKLIKHDFIREDCVEIVNRKKAMLVKCEKEGGNCNNLLR
jgi:hypothetical protein